MISHFAGSLRSPFTGLGSRELVVLRLLRGNWRVECSVCLLGRGGGIPLAGELARDEAKWDATMALAMASILRVVASSLLNSGERLGD